MAAACQDKYSRNSCCSCLASCGHQHLPCAYWLIRKGLAVCRFCAATHGFIDGSDKPLYQGSATRDVQKPPETTFANCLSCIQCIGFDIYHDNETPGEPRRNRHISGRIDYLLF